MSDVSRTSLDKLSKHWASGKDDSTLPERERKLLERMNFVDNLIRGYRSRKFCITALRKKFPEISQATAYRDYNDTKRFFGSLSLADKEYDRGILEEMAMKGIRMALELGDLKSYFAGIREVRLIRGYSNEDFNKIPVEDLINKQIIVKAAGARGPIEINLDNAEEVDYEEVEELLEMTSIFNQDIDKLQESFVKKDGANTK